MRAVFDVQALDVFRHPMFSSYVLIPCTDNAKHRLIYKLMYISCLLTVIAGYVTY